MNSPYRLFLLSMAAVMMSGCHSKVAPKATPIETVKMHIVISQSDSATSIARATGTLHAKENTILSAQITGRVRQVLVHEGDIVRSGETLIVLDDATYKSGLDQSLSGVIAAQHQQQAAQSESALAESTLARYRQLQAQKSVSPQEMDEVSRRAEGAAARVIAMQAQVEAAKAQESGARTMMSYARIHAPFNGVISARMVDPGAMAAPGLPLLQLEGTGALQLQVSVDESVLAKVHKGMKVIVHIDGAIDSVRTGMVSEISPSADTSSHSFTVKIDIPQSKQIKAGMFGSAEIETGKHHALLIPATACVQRGSLHYVYALDANNVALLRAITIGAQTDRMLEVLSGLSANEKLVDQPGDRDLNGKRIEAQ